MAAIITTFYSKISEVIAPSTDTTLTTTERIDDNRVRETRFTTRKKFTISAATTITTQAATTTIATTKTTKMISTATTASKTTITVSDESSSTDLTSITSTQPISALTTPLVEAKQEVSSTILDAIIVISEPKLSTLITPIPILLSRSSTSILQSINMSLSPARITTVRSEKSGYILLYSLFGLLSVIICVVTTTLSAGFIHSWRALRYLDDNDLYTILNHTNTDVTSSIDDQTNRLGNSSKASLSLPLIPFHQSNVANMDFKQSFDDNTF